MGYLPDSSTIAAKLATTRRILCASPDYIARHGKPKAPADLADHACLVHSLYTARNVWYFRRRGELRALLVKGRFVANNSEALLAAALQGLGIALLGSWAVPKEIANGEFVPLLPDWQGDLTREQRHLYLTYPRSARTSLLTRTFVDYFRAHIGTPPYWEPRPRQKN
jgi:DNA-binding transcriptional LysR family regulator